LIHYRLFCAATGLLIAIVILFFLKRDSIHPFYTLWWLILAGCVLTLGFFPSIVDFIGRTMEIHYPPILLIVLSLCFIVVKMLKMDIERTRMEQKLRRLIQHVAILEARKEYPASYEMQSKNDENSEEERSSK